MITYTFNYDDYIHLGYILTLNREAVMQSCPRGIFTMVSLNREAVMQSCPQEYSRW